MPVEASSLSKRITRSSFLRYIACFAAVVSITEITRWQRSVPMRLALVALALSFSQQGVNSRPLKTLRSVRTDFVAVPGSLDFIPDDFRVLVSDFDAAFVAEGEPVLVLLFVCSPCGHVITELTEALYLRKSQVPVRSDSSLGEGLSPRRQLVRKIAPVVGASPRFQMLVEALGPPQGWS